MQSVPSAGILGVGMAVPERVLSNADLEKMVDTSDEWIVTRTGIRERRITGPGETCATLGTQAAQAAIVDAGVDPAEIGLVICATATGDHIWPATACLIQRGVGALKAGAVDLSAACSGFTYGLATAAGLVTSGTMRYVLVVGADTLTKHVDWQDRATCVLFGDGAGAAVVGPCAAGEGILASDLGADGRAFELLYLPAGGTRMPVTHEVIDQKLNRMMMRGAEVYKFAVRIMGDASMAALARAGLDSSDVDLFIPHQANLRIITAAAHRMGLSEDRVFVNVEKYGNTSSASVPMALVEARQQGRVKRGSVLVFVAFGAGLTWGANVVRWSRD